MSKGLTPMNVRSQLHDMVALVFSGLHKEGTKIRAGKGESRFLTEKIYRAVSQLSREFPDFFPGYRDGNLEDILFSLGAFNIAPLCGPHMRFHGVSPEMKKALAENTLKNLGGDKIRKLLPVIERFNALMAD